MLIAGVEDALKKGVADTIHMAFDLSKEAYKRIYPEYLKTIKVAEALRSAMDPSAAVSMEEPTNAVLGRSLLFPRAPKWTKAVGRSGRVDICVASPDDARPVVLVENKRYVRGFGLIARDALRCVQFLRAANLNGEGSIALTAVTYLIKCDAGFTSNDHLRLATPILQDIENQAKVLAGGVVQHKHIHVAHPIKVYADQADANVLGFDNVPAHVEEPALTVFGGIELYWRDDRLGRLGPL